MPPPTITTTSLPDGTVGTTYGQTLAAVEGTPPYTWSVSAGAPPPGLDLFPTGELTGHPTSAGTFTFTAKVDDAGTPSQSDTQELTVTIDPEPVAPPTITTTTLPGGSRRCLLHRDPAGDGRHAGLHLVSRFGITPGRSKPELSTGVISGTPTSGGVSTFTAKVTDGASQTDTAGPLDHHHGPDPGHRDAERNDCRDRVVPIGRRLRTSPRTTTRSTK